MLIYMLILIKNLWFLLKEGVYIIKPRIKNVTGGEKKI